VLENLLGGLQRLCCDNLLQFLASHLARTFPSISTFRSHRLKTPVASRIA
jgi:hypothetical protein